MRFIYTLLSGICFTFSLTAQDTLFFENFAGSPGTRPSGWTTELESGDSRWQFVNGGGTKNPDIPGSRRPPTAYSDTVNALYFFESLEGQSVILVTPPVNLEFAIRPELRFMHVQREGNLGFGAAHDELRIYYKTDFEAPWQEVNKIAEYTDEVFDWTQQVVILPEEAFVPECYFAFKATTNYGWGVGIDDVSVIETEVQPRVVNQLTVHQAATDMVPAGSRWNPILRIDISVSGNTGSLALNSLDMSALNTDDADIGTDGVKLFYNHVNKDFYAATLLDSVSLGSGAAQFTSLDLNLPSGYTSLWVTYDVAQDAGHNHQIDAMIPAGSIGISGNTFPSSDLSPSGTRTIREAVFYDDFSTERGWSLSGDFQRERPMGLGGNFLGNPDPLNASGDTLILGNDLTGLGFNPGDYEASVNRYDNLAVSPESDLMYYNDVRISFLRWLNVANNDTASLEMSLDGGLEWNEVWNNDNNVIADGEWKQMVLEIPEADREPEVRFRFNLGPTTPTDHLSGWNIENFAVTGNYVEYDVSPVALLSPGTGCGHSAAETISIRVRNLGPDATPANIPVRYSIDGGAHYTEEILTGPIPFGGERDFDFSGTADLSVPGAYHVIIETTLGVDEAPENNILDTILYVDPTYYLPYQQNFESGSDFWRAEGTLPTFEHGVPLGSVIHTAASGTKAWVTNLDGVYNNGEESYLTGPCFDFTGTDYPVFECKLYYITEEGKDGASLEYSLDNGQNWFRVGNLGEGDAFDWNWYNSDAIEALSGGHGWTGGPKTWTTARIMLDTTIFRNMPGVKFRFHFASDASGRQEGIGIDDIHIYDINRDVGVVSIELPVDGCTKNIGDHVAVTVKNFGLDTLMAGESILVGYDLESEATVLDTLILESDLLSGGSVPFVFRQMLQVPAIGTRDIEAFTLLEGDINFYNEATTNDTASKTFEVVQTPYVDLPGTIFTVRPDTVVLDAGTGEPGDTYLWQDGSADPQFHVTDFSDGIYHATVSNAYCSSSDTTRLVRLIADLGVTGILQPVSGCELGASVRPVITITNFGTDTLRNGSVVPVRYRIDSDPAVEESAILEEDLLPDSTFTYRFTTSSEMTEVKVYILEAYTALAYDDTLSNDAFTLMIEAFGFTPVDLGEDTVVRGFVHTLDPGSGYDSYLWQDGSTGQTFEADTSGTYRVIVQQGTMCPGADSIRLTLLVPDLGLSTLESPSTGCRLTTGESVSFYIYNRGTDTLKVNDTVWISWEMEGFPEVFDTIQPGKKLVPGDSLLYESSETVDLSGNGTYQFQAEVGTRSDLVPENNSLLHSIEVYDPPVISLGPDTVVSDKHYLLDPGEGYDAYLWQDGSTGQEFEALYEMQSADSLYSVVVTDVSGCESFDTVRITFDLWDLGLSTLLSPVSDCELSGQEKIRLMAINHGTHPFENDTVTLSAQVNAGSPVQMQQVITGPVNPGDSLTFEFPHQFDLSRSGEHLFRIGSMFGKDDDPENDTMVVAVWNYGIPDPDPGSGSDTLEVDLPYLLDGGDGYSIYQWNGSAGEQTYEATAYGWVTVEVITDKGCSGIDSVYLMSATGLEDHALPGQLNVFPVPANQFLQVEFNGPEQDDLYLEIYDPAGRKMLVRRYPAVRGFSERLDVSLWKEGMYFLTLRSDQGYIVRAISVSSR